ncbi:MAG: SDR family oxidoreductase [Janthinobacterium lividum]
MFWRRFCKSTASRAAWAEEIANTTAFLLSACASHTTSQLLHVDGGCAHLDHTLANA